MITFRCSQCQALIEASEDAIGQEVICPSCGGATSLPGWEIQPTGSDGARLLPPALAHYLSLSTPLDGSILPPETAPPAPGEMLILNHRPSFASGPGPRIFILSVIILVIAGFNAIGLVQGGGPSFVPTMITLNVLLLAALAPPALWIAYVRRSRTILTTHRLIHVHGMFWRRVTDTPHRPVNSAVRYASPPTPTIIFSGVCGQFKVYGLKHPTQFIAAVRTFANLYHLVPERWTPPRHVPPPVPGSAPRGAASDAPLNLPKDPRLDWAVSEKVVALGPPGEGTPALVGLDPEIDRAEPLTAWMLPVGTQPPRPGEKLVRTLEYSFRHPPGRASFFFSIVVGFVLPGLCLLAAITGHHYMPPVALYSYGLGCLIVGLAPITWWALYIRHARTHITTHRIVHVSGLFRPRLREMWHMIDNEIDFGVFPLDCLIVRDGFFIIHLYCDGVARRRMARLLQALCIQAFRVNEPPLQAMAP